MKNTKRVTFTVLFYLKKNNPKADGTIPIMGRITINGKSSAFSTQLSIPPKLGLDNNRVTRKTNEAKKINNKLKAIEARIKNIYDVIVVNPFIHYKNTLISKDRGYLSSWNSFTIKYPFELV